MLRGVSGCRERASCRSLHGGGENVACAAPTVLILGWAASSIVIGVFHEGKHKPANREIGVPGKSCAAPTGLKQMERIVMCDSYPGLPARASLCRPYGAGFRAALDSGMGRRVILEIRGRASGRGSNVVCGIQQGRGISSAIDPPNFAIVRCGVTVSTTGGDFRTMNL